MNSLFDDSDSGDDLFSNTSSGSRSQKSADQASAQSTDKPKIITSRLFDAGVDVFLNRPPDIDIFAESGTGQRPTIPSPSIPSKTNQVLKSTKSVIKNRNLFDDEDDEDLFAVSNSNSNPSSSVMETSEKSLAGPAQVAEDVKKEVINPEMLSKPNISESSNLFDDVDEDDSLFQKSPKTAKSSEILNPPPVDSGETTDGPAVSKQKSGVDVVTKIEPPKSLKIRLPVMTDDALQAPRRAVSGKIKNLMGKMGDFKILSPTDTPPLWRRGEEKNSGEGEEKNSGEGTPVDSEDGGAMSAPKTPTSPLPSKFWCLSGNWEIVGFGVILMFLVIGDSASKEASLSPSILDTEIAVSFDVPAQAETLSIASKVI